MSYKLMAAQASVLAMMGLQVVNILDVLTYTPMRPKLTQSRPLCLRKVPIF